MGNLVDRAHSDPRDAAGHVVPPGVRVQSGERSASSGSASLENSGPTGTVAASGLFGCPFSVFLWLLLTVEELPGEVEEQPCLGIDRVNGLRGIFFEFQIASEA